MQIISSLLGVPMCDQPQADPSPGGLCGNCYLSFSYHCSIALVFTPLVYDHVEQWVFLTAPQVMGWRLLNPSLSWLQKKEGIAFDGVWVKWKMYTFFYEVQIHPSH